MAKVTKHLTKSRDKVVSGVLGGVAEYFGLDKAWTLIIGGILIVFPGQIFFGLIVYFIAALVMPEPDSKDGSRSNDDDVIEGEFRER